MERDERERERNDKKEERERNDLAEGPRSRTERNDFKKVGTCPALILGTQTPPFINLISILHVHDYHEKSCDHSNTCYHCTVYTVNLEEIFFLQ